MVEAEEAEEEASLGGVGHGHGGSSRRVALWWKGGEGRNEGRKEKKRKDGMGLDWCFVLLGERGQFLVGWLLLDVATQ